MTSDYPSIEFTAEDAAVILDLVRSMNQPGSPEAVMLDLRRARYLLPKVEQAFRDSEWDLVGHPEADETDFIERPEIPLLVPGSKFSG